MIVNIKGSTKKTRELVETAAWFYAEKLMGMRLAKTLEININLIRNYTEKMDCEGTCIWDDWATAKTPRGYTIELDSSISLRNLLINLAHEFVHVKQWVRGEMYEYASPNKVRFMKKVYDMKDISYYYYPCEIEAFGRQEGLFIRWCEEDGLTDREDLKEVA